MSSNDELRVPKQFVPVEEVIDGFRGVARIDIDRLHADLDRLVQNPEA